MANYIDKDKLIKELSVIQNRPVHTATKIIQELPTEEVQPVVRGEWLNPTYIKSEDWYEGECSICHKIRVCDYFCSSCGAKMDEKKVEE